MTTNNCKKPCPASTFDMYIVFIEKAFVMKIIFLIQNCCRWDATLKDFNDTICNQVAFKIVPV